MVKNVTCLRLMDYSQTVLKFGRPKSSKSIRVNDPNSNNIQIKSK